MKTLISTFLVAVALMGFTSLAKADQRLEGIWENEQNRIVITVESTRDGIRVKRSGQNRWYTYQRFRENQFRDREGNIYYLNHDNSLEWEDRTGRKRIRFHRRSTNRFGDDRQEDRERNYPHQFNGKRQRDTYIERNHRYGRSNRIRIAAHELRGRWINPTTGQTIQVKTRHNQLRVKTHHSGWATFTRQDGNTFIDRRGNRYDFIRNKLVYTSRNNDFRMEFRRH